MGVSRSSSLPGTRSLVGRERVKKPSKTPCVLRFWRTGSLKKFVRDDFKEIIQWNLNITNLYITKSSA